MLRLTFLIIIASSFLKEGMSICVSNAECQCSISPKGDYQVDCPKSDRRRLTLNVEPDKYIYVQCTIETRSDDYKLLPKLATTKIQQITFHACPMNENTTFYDIFQQMGIDEVNAIKFQTNGLNAPKLFSRNQLQDLDNVTVLEISDSAQITEIQPDLLYDLTNLTALRLVHNDLNSIQNDFFQENTNLKYIDLGLNNLDVLPLGIFDNLINLEQLNIWKTNLSTLNENIFAKLLNLETLDLHEDNLETLPTNIFENLTRLRVIRMNHNRFSVLPSELFKHNYNLAYVQLSMNFEKLELPESFLTNLPNLTEIYMDSSNIVKLEENLFWNSFSISNISIANNMIEVLPELIFRDCKNLYSLNLSGNRIKVIPNQLFRNMDNLHVLNMANNQLSEIASNTFSNYRQLKLVDINLSNNLINVVEKDAFSRVSNLESINLSNNNISSSKTVSPFTNLLKLRVLNLANNTIDRISDDWRITMLALESLNLSNNIIGWLDFSSLHFLSNGIVVDLRNNKINYIDMRRAEVTAQQQTGFDAISGRKKNIVVLLSNNPIYCDCETYNLIRYFEGKMDYRVRAMVEISTKNLTCSKPDAYAGRKLENLRSEEIICPVLSTKCPSNCTCFARYYDKSMVIDCDNRNLSELPAQLPNFKQYPNIILHANKNKLNQIYINPDSANKTGYINLRELYAAENRISYINWLPKKLQINELHSNQFQSINVTLFKNLPHLKLLTLHNNPFVCDCENLDLLTFVQDEYKKIRNVSHILCNNKMSLVEMTSDDLCPFPTVAIVSLSSVCVLISIIVAALLITFYRNEEAIKVWLFAHNKCLWWVTEEELDKNKKYDAFVSYAHNDEDFVVKQLIPNLEQTDKPYKLCIHKRDWIAGEWIPNQIARSVEESRRTLVVLSPSFLDSVWGKMEFRSAHVNALKEGRTRVIIIKYKEIGSYDKLDPELRAYLTMNTYIEWGERNFWDKLRYALPHPPPLNKRAELILQRMKQSLGTDKVEMITSPRTITSQPSLSEIITSPSQIGQNTQLTNSNGILDKNPLILRVNPIERKDLNVMRDVAL